MFTWFLLYGVLGWSVEVFWSAVEDSCLRRARDWRLKGQSYLWSFPLYRLIVFLFEPLHNAARPLPWVARGLIYVPDIWTVEYAAGWSLKRAFGRCPWEYTSYRHHLHGLISWGVARKSCNELILCIYFGCCLKLEPLGARNVQNGPTIQMK